MLLEGDSNRLSHGFDFRAELCGVTGLSARPFMYWPSSTGSVISLCIPECPYIVKTSSICIYDTDHTTLLKDLGCYDAYASRPYGKYCVPTQDGWVRTMVLDYLFQSMEVMKRGTGDLLIVRVTQTKGNMLAGIIISALVGTVYIVLFRYSRVLKPLIYTSVVLGEVLILLWAYFVYEAALVTKGYLCDTYHGAVPQSCYSGPASDLNILALVFAILAGVNLFVIAMRFRQLRTGVNLVQVAAKPIHGLKQLFIFPYCQLLVGGAVLVLMVFVLVWTMSAGQVVSQTDDYVPGREIKVIEYSTTERGYLAVIVFMSLWWIAFLSGIGEGIMAIGVSVWYYTREKSSLNWPLIQALKFTFRYHVGSYALGSIVHVTLYFPQLILGNISKALRYKLKAEARCRNTVSKLCYCLDAYERWLKFYTKFAYIFVLFTQIGLFGEKYSLAAKRCHFLLQRHYKRLHLPLTSTSVVSWTVKLVIALSGPSFTFYSLLSLAQTALTDDDPSNVVSVAGPSFITLMLCLYVAQVFGGTLEACTNSVLVCSACDEEMFTREQRFVEEDVAEFLDFMGKEQTQVQADSTIERKSHHPQIAFELARKHEKGGSEVAINSSPPPPELFEPKPLQRNQILFGNEDSARTDYQTEGQVQASQRPGDVYGVVARLGQDSAEDSRPKFSPVARTKA